MTFATQAGALEEILYCTPDSTVGFEPKNNYETLNFEDERFTLKVNFKANSMKSDKIYLNNTVKCSYNDISEVIYCMSNLGTTVALHKKSKKFHLASIYLKSQQTDDIFMAHGSCEKF